MSAEFVRLCAVILEDEGFEIETVESGEACLKAVETKTYACILLDIWLGDGIDGLETLKRLRENGNDSAVIMISGHGNIETAVKSTKLGAFDFIEKPLSLEKTDSYGSKCHSAQRIRKSQCPACRNAQSGICDDWRFDCDAGFTQTNFDCRAN